MATTTNNGWTTPDDTDLVKDGALAIRDLGQEIDTSVGEGLLAWQTWAPTLSGGWLNGNGTWTAKYAKLGKIVHISAFFTLGSTTTKGTGFIISLPLPIATSARLMFNHNARANVATTGFRMGLANFGNSSIELVALNAAGTYLTDVPVSATVPATWVTGDELRFGLTYETSA
jgi:hypothetical protein